MACGWQPTQSRTSSSTTGSRKERRTIQARRPWPAWKSCPSRECLNGLAKTQQLVVRVHGPDKTVRDVTQICYYDSSNPEIAEVDAGGYVRFKTRGEVAIIAHYLNLVANVRLTHLVEVPGFVQAEVPQDNLIDRAVFTKLNRMRIAASAKCTDLEFIRRVYLDVMGVLPTPDERQAISGRFSRWPPQPRDRAPA